MQIQLILLIYVTHFIVYLLVAFLDLVNSVKPHLLFLLGPFVDINNSIIQSGIIKINDQYVDYEELFQTFMQLIWTSLEVKENNTTKVVIQPSLRDATSLYPMPQPSFEDSLVLFF